ncbi:MAG: hypothetical protein WAT51_07120 [Holophaga sp.]
MRLLHLLPLAPFILQAAPPVSLEEATSQMLDAFDDGCPPAALPRPSVIAKERPSLAWLRVALSEPQPQNPFPKAHRSHAEAERTRALLAATPDRYSALLATVQPGLAGSFAALWRWGQARARGGEFSVAQRHGWEDLLADPKSPMVIRGWALRHALCFALAEGDETRLAALKTTFALDLPDFFQTFQRAFALLGGPAPRFYAWTLPELKPLDLSLSRLGSRVYVSFLDTPAPADAAWIVPAQTSNLPADLSTLEGESLAEATHTATMLRALGRSAHFVPSRAPLEALAMVYFPIDIRLDVAGMIQSIRMGDAAQAKPTP